MPIVHHVILDLYCDLCPIGNGIEQRTTERVMEKTFENAKIIACRRGWSFKKDLCRCPACGKDIHGNGRGLEWPDRVET
jgi:hypothetical protein